MIISFIFLILFELIILNDLITIENTIKYLEQFQELPQRDSLQIIFKTFNAIKDRTYEVTKVLKTLIL